MCGGKKTRPVSHSSHTVICDVRQLPSRSNCHRGKLKFLTCTSKWRALCNSMTIVGCKTLSPSTTIEAAPALSIATKLKAFSRQNAESCGSTLQRAFGRHLHRRFSYEVEDAHTGVCTTDTSTRRRTESLVSLRARRHLQKKVEILAWSIRIA